MNRTRPIPTTSMVDNTNDELKVVKTLLGLSLSFVIVPVAV